MYRLLAFFLAFSCCAQDVKIIVAGQSNAVGYAPGDSGAPDAAVLAWNPATQSFVPAVDPMPFFTQPLAGCTGAWVRLGKLLHKKYDTVRITGGGRGGMPISYWDEGQEGWTNLSVNIQASGKDANWFIWYQGESDTDLNLIGGYAAKLSALIARVRALVDNPNLSVIVVQLADTTKTAIPADFPQMRMIQYNYTLQDDNAFLIQTLGFPLGPDNVHLTVDGYTMLARSCAKLILNSTWFQGAAGKDGKDGKDGWQPPPGMLIFMGANSSQPDNTIYVKKFNFLHRFPMIMYLQN